MTITKAVLLAAGRGTRMRELTADVPKPMIKVRGKPILLHIIEGLQSARIKNFLIIVGYHGEMVREYFGDGTCFGLRINYATQTVQDGTGRVVELARESGSVEESLAAADSACYQAKRQGGHVMVYSARDQAYARQTGEIHWLQLLQTALRDHRFELYCQPIVAAYGDGDAGPAMEVFVRLRNDAGEQVSTTEFLQAAHRYRLMGLIDRQVVQTTLTALGRGAIALPHKRSIGINISGQTLADSQFLDFVVECFDATGASPAQVCFEIAESTVIANLDQARRFIGVLHGMGCRFALDNFGSGMGSFANLKLLAVDFLKIDGSYMRNLARDSVNQAMVGAMIKLARTLNFKVIAEQVEDDSAVAAARSIGVDYLQGYALGRPAPLPIAA